MLCKYAITPWVASFVLTTNESLQMSTIGSFISSGIKTTESQSQNLKKNLFLNLETINLTSGISDTS